MTQSRHAYCTANVRSLGNGDIDTIQGVATRPEYEEDALQDPRNRS
jgi:hypothetical protein